jgi:hypothetical protein
MVRNVALSFAAQQVFIGYGSEHLRSYLTAIWLTACTRPRSRTGWHACAPA